MKFDIFIDFDHNDYLLDVELRTDFLTSSLRMILLIKDGKKYHKAAISHWQNEEAE